MNLWHILTTPGKDLVQEAVKAHAFAGSWAMIFDLIDVSALFLLVGSLLLVMLGSKKAGKVTYWTLAIYIVFKLVVSVLSTTYS